MAAGLFWIFRTYWSVLSAMTWGLVYSVFAGVGSAIVGNSGPTPGYSESDQRAGTGWLWWFYFGGALFSAHRFLGEHLLFALGVIVLGVLPLSWAGDRLQARADRVKADRARMRAALAQGAGARDEAVGSSR